MSGDRRTVRTTQQPSRTSIASVRPSAGRTESHPLTTSRSTSYSASSRSTTRRQTLDANPAFTGRASRGIARKLRQHGFRVIADPESFLVTADNTLVDGGAVRAETWARSVLSAPRDQD